MEHHEEIISMTELCTRLTNTETANLLLFQVVFGVSSLACEKILDSADKNQIHLLSERPGLQRITYSAKFDHFNN